MAIGPASIRNAGFEARVRTKNFNPQAGIGMEFCSGSDPSFVAALRAHCVSNTELDDDYRGLHPVASGLGRFF